MLFYSTSGHVKEVSFKEAVLQGIAPDGGLYLPQSLPHFSAEEMAKWKSLSFLELSIELSSRIFEGIFSRKEVEQLCTEAFDFPLPFLSFPHKIHLLELFHGPSLSFKDIGARFLAALLRLWSKEGNRRVLVATSGDTGSAVGLALAGQPGIEVYILFAKCQ